MDAWDRLKAEGETEKAYNGFLTYLSMPPNERSLIKVSRQLGHKAKTTVEGWSRRFRWRERVAAWEDYQAQTTFKAAIEVRRTTLAEAQEATIQNWQVFDIAARELIMRALADMRKEYEQTGKLNTSDFKRLVDAAHTLDTTTRRALGLPTGYKTETIEEPNTETMEFFVG